MAKGALIAVLLLAGCAAPVAQLPMTEDGFAARVTVQDSPLETAALFTSPQAGASPPGAQQVNANDAMIRAYVDKKTGKTDFQVYVRVDQSNETWANFYAINYLDAAGRPTSADTVKVRSHVQCYGSRVSSCVYDEHVIAYIPEALLRSIRARYAAGEQTQRWALLVKGQTMEVNLAIPYGQIAGLLARVDAYSANAKQPGQTPN